jgi:hypothetical protein
MRVLIACEYSGRVREAFRAKGHEAWSIDLLPSEDNSPFHVVGDVLDYLKDHARYFDLMIAHPPCTYLANSGVRWLGLGVKPNQRPDTARYQKMLDGAKFFADLFAAPIPKIACENPVMHGYGRANISDLLIRRGLGLMPDTHFCQPWWFGEPAYKATGFTLKGLPPLVEDPILTLRASRPKKGDPDYKAWSAVHYASPGPNRWKERSRTSQGVANALANQWG